MNKEQREALAEAVLSWADDEMILAHRNSEWTGHAPILEEDIAFTNIALDEMGHAQLWYQLHAEIIGEDPDTYPDEVIFYREVPQYRNVQFVELPKGDWAFSMLRQYLFDAYERVRLPGLTESSHKPLSEVAAKIRSEEAYHLRHTEAWVRRLGLGTEESNQRMQRALDSMWGYALQLFVPTDKEVMLEERGLIPTAASVEGEWLERVETLLEESNLASPEVEEPEVSDRQQHSEHLVGLLSDMQHVARSFPEVEW